MKLTVLRRPAALVAGLVTTGLLMTPAVAKADGSQSETLFVPGGGWARVYKTWENKNSAGQFDGVWGAEPGPGVHVRVYYDGPEKERVYYPIEVIRAPYYDVAVLRMKACNETRCTAPW